MQLTQDEQHQRRQFIQWLAASPLFALGLDQTVIAQEAKELSRNVLKRPMRLLDQTALVVRLLEFQNLE